MLQIEHELRRIMKMNVHFLKQTCGSAQTLVLDFGEKNRKECVEKLR